jgi:hypothetical protein
MRFRTWPVAAIGLASLLLLVAVSILAASRKAQDIYSELDRLNTRHHDVDAKLRRLRSDVNLSGIFLRDYLLDIAREHAPEDRQRLEAFRTSNMATLSELRALELAESERIARLQSQLEEYWQTFDPMFDWTISEKLFLSPGFLRREVVPRRDAVLSIAQEIEELNNANLLAQRSEVTRQHARAILLVRAMIAAANADGQIDADERRRILEKLQDAGLDHEDRAFIEKELRAPRSLDVLIQNVHGQQDAAQIYAASLFAITVDKEAEHTYLKSLADRLGLDNGTVKALNNQMGLAA